MAISQVPKSAEQLTGRTPLDMSGTFAFVSTTRGFVYVVNIDDDNFPDFDTSSTENDPNAPAAATFPLALAHQLRDFNFE